MKPLAHRDALLLQNVGDQLVAYDGKSKRLHVLSRTAALVWQNCDGNRDVAQLAEIVGRELGTTVDSAVIQLALDQLNEAQLLTPAHASTPLSNSVTRREMVNRALSGLAAGILMPVVTSCGSLVDSTIAVGARSNLGLEETTTTSATTPLTTTTSSTSPITTTTSTTTPITTTTSTTTPITTTTSTTSPPVTTTTTTSPPTTTTTTTTTVATTTTPQPQRVQMCHKGKTILVDRHAVETHLAHGDTLGPCPG